MTRRQICHAYEAAKSFLFNEQRNICRSSGQFSFKQDNKKLFEAIVAGSGQNVNRNPTRMRPILVEAPKIHYNTYTFTPRQTAIHDSVMGRIKGKRTSVQPYYHEKKLIARQNKLGGIVNFDNTGTQFAWLIIPIIPVFTKA